MRAYRYRASMSYIDYTKISKKVNKKVNIKPKSREIIVCGEKIFKNP